MKALDSETSGIDFYHGAKPYLVTTCNEEQENTFWEWDVDPLTREPQIPEEDIEEIQELVETEELVLHNPKFDFHALETIGKFKFNWDKVHDTLMMAHLLASSQAKDLTTLTLVHLGINVKPYEDRVEEVVKECRRLCKKNYPEWRIAKRGLPEMPSAKETVWKLDMWLPKAYAKAEGYPEDHLWNHLTAEYANSDTASTIRLAKILLEKIEEKGLMKLYKERMKVLPIIYKMESNGITLNKHRLNELMEDYQRTIQEDGETCVGIAKEYGFDLELPKTVANKSLKTFCFDSNYLDLPVIHTTAKGDPSLNADAKAEYELTLEGNQLEFIKAFNRRCKTSVSVAYLEAYENYSIDRHNRKDLRTIYSSVNPTGTATLRASSQNPNQQQISKKRDSEGRTLRYIFGPAPGREWWSIDFDNLELRIPAYECGEPAMLELFENPNKAPFYGSYHLLIASIIYEKQWNDCVRKNGEEKAGEVFREKYKDTYYKWTKNGNFADQYGAVDTGDGQGTADKAFRVPGAQAIIASKLTQKASLNEKWISIAQNTGYVETMPDRLVDPERGYPIQCRKTKWGSVKPTLPLNYHVQGTACWVKMRAMVKVQEYLNTLDDGIIIMEIHDELVFDFPFRKNKRNLPKIRTIRRLMESCGDDIGVNLTCGVDYHPVTWSEVA
jgi:DNA polymerase I-like protein with 3'-5' exonuclease and polymerase domains